jgi:hypothetical protein
MISLFSSLSEEESDYENEEEPKAGKVNQRLFKKIIGPI